MRNTTILLAVLAVLAWAVPAHGWVTWSGNGADDLWETGANWGGTAPQSTDDANIGSNKANDPDHPCTIASTTDADAKDVYLGYNIWPLDAFSHMEQTGGTADFQTFYLGYYGGSTSSRGKYKISGGTLACSGTLYIGNASTDNDAGYFTVIGAGGTITAASYNQGATGTTSFEIDGTSGITAIQITGGGTATLDGDLVVTTSDTGHTGTYTLMTYGSKSGAFDNITVPDDWTYDVGDTAVTVTVPEPATLSLLGIGGLGVLLRRRRS